MTQAKSAQTVTQRLFADESYRQRGIMPLRMVGTASGDPYSPHSVSGVPRHLFDALERRYPMAGRVNAALAPWQHYPVALATFHPSRGRWRERFWKNELAFQLQSRNGRAGLAQIRAPYDVVFQIHALFRTTDVPSIVYVDNTHRQTLAGWPRWNPLRGRALSRWLAEEQAIYERAVHLFTMGEPAAKSLRADYGIPAERVTNVGGGANFTTLPLLSEGVREPTILFVGKDWRRKGGEVLIEAFRHVRAHFPGARLQIVGTAEAPAGPGIEVFGRIADRNRLAELYARASIFCLPSHFDPFPLVLMEAMASGLPCVASAVCGIPEIVADGETGLLVPPGDAERLANALLRLLGQPETARALGAAGRARIEQQLSWERVVDRMVPVLDRLTVIREGRCAVGQRLHAKRASDSVAKW